MKQRSGKVQQISACFIEPMLCLAVLKLPEGPAWQYEAKARRLSRHRCSDEKRGRALVATQKGRCCGASGHAVTTDSGTVKCARRAGPPLGALGDHNHQCPREAATSVARMFSGLVMSGVG